MLGKRLKLLREEKELGQKDIAGVLNITTSAYGFWEQGKREPNAESLSILADYFDVSVDYLLGRSDVRNPYDGIKTIAAHKDDGYDKPLSKEDLEQIESLLEKIKKGQKPD